MSARIKLLTEGLRSGGGKAKYHDVPPEHVFHGQQRADNFSDNKCTSCSSSLCFVFGVSRNFVSRCQRPVVCLQAARMDS